MVEGSDALNEKNLAGDIKGIKREQRTNIENTKLLQEDLNNLRDE